jgi:ribonuclease E
MSDHWQNLADKLKTPSPNPIPRKSSAPPEKIQGDSPGHDAAPSTPPPAKTPATEPSDSKPAPKKSSSWDAISKFLGIGGGSSSESPAKADSGGFGFWGTPSKPAAPATPEPPVAIPPSMPTARIPEEPTGAGSVQESFGATGRKRRGKPSLWETPEEVVAPAPVKESSSRTQTDVESAPSSPRGRETRLDAGSGGTSAMEGQRDARGFTEHSRSRDESPKSRRDQVRNPEPAREARRDAPAPSSTSRANPPSPRGSEDAPTDRRGQRRPSRRALASGVEATNPSGNATPPSPPTFSDTPARPSRDVDPWDLEDAPDIAEPKSVEHSEGESSEETGPRRRRRRGRRGGRGSRSVERGASEPIEGVTEEGPQPIAASDREPAPRSRPSRSRDAMVEPERIDWQDELEPAEESLSGESSRALRKVPTWSDAIAILVEGNMENHRRTPASSGRGPRSRPQDAPRTERPQEGGRRRSESSRSESPRPHDRPDDRPAKAPAARSQDPRSGGPRSDAYRDEPSSSPDRPRSEDDRPSEGRRRYDRSRPPRRRPPGDQASSESSVD